MGAIDLHKIAIAMSNVIKLLSEIQPKMITGDDVYEHKNDLCFIAYVCRIGILDRIEENSYMLNPRLPIRIPIGIFRSRKETMESALNLTIGKLKEIVSEDVVTEGYVEDIFNRCGIFYEFENNLPDKLKRSL